MDASTRFFRGYLERLTKPISIQLEKKEEKKMSSLKALQSLTKQRDGMPCTPS
jgi:hypothetical protein